jgi:O-antigen polymerase
VLLTALFLVAPFYIQSNMGGAGFDLPYNIAVWIVASWLIALSVYNLISKQQFIIPKLWPFLIAFPSIIVLNGLLVSEAALPDAWLFKQLYIIGGVFFLFGLFQFDLERKAINHILFLIVVASGLHATIGIGQIFIPHDLPEWVPVNNTIPRGMFQQINVQASFLVTGVIIALYLVTELDFENRAFYQKGILLLAYITSLYIVFASGSRVGLLALVLAVALLILARYKEFKKQAKMTLLIALLSICAFIAGQSDLQKTIDKSAQLTEKSYSTARIAMYTIGVEIVSQKPLLGHGIGSFLTAWNPQASDFYLRYPETNLPNYVTHPHNEVLLWMIEGGLLAVIGLILFTVGIFIALYGSGFSCGAAYAALLIPISLHTQVELPFYISSVHWFLWLFLIYIAMKNNTKIIEVNISEAATKLIQSVNIIFVVIVTLFLFNTAKAQLDIYNYLTGKDTGRPHLSVALNNLYTKNYAEQLAMRSNLYANIENNNREGVENFVVWANDYVSKSPELKMYENLISASVFLNPKGKGCDMVKEALTMYAHNEPLQKARDEKCN